MIRDFCVVYDRRRGTVNWLSGAPIVQRGLEAIASGPGTPERIIELYLEHGDLLGMAIPLETSFALWDRDRRTLIVARDPAGVRSLYVREGPETFAFATRIASLSPREFDPLGLGGHLGGLPVTDATCFRGIRSLEPTSFLFLRDGACETVGFGRKHRGTAEDLRLRLEQAVRSRCGDGLTAFALSGGLDSALLLALAPRGVRPYTLAPRNEAYSEVRAAQRTAATLGLDPVLVPIEERDLVSALPRAVAAVEAPLLNLHAVSKLLLGRAVRADGLGILVGGEGADEYFAEPGPLRWDVELATVAASPIELSTGIELTVQPLPRNLHLLMHPSRSLLFQMTDRVLSSAGVELRLPFLDPGITGIGEHLESEDLRDKTALRDLAATLLPHEIAERPKRPMLAPPVDFFSQYLRDEAIERSGVFKTREVHELYARFKKTPDDPRLDRAMMRIVTTLLLYEQLIAPCAG